MSRGRRPLILLLVLLVLLLRPTSASSPRRTTVVLSNTQLPTSSSGRPVVTGETSVVFAGGRYYVYVNDWGGCEAVDCCPSKDGCASCCYVPATPLYPDACIFANNHTVKVYSTTNFASPWHLEGVALSLAARPAGIEFRPHVVHNPRTGEFVMWFEDRPSPINSSGYAVATSRHAAGPFTTVQSPVVMADVPGDFDLLVDENGTGWHVQTTTTAPAARAGFAITKLNDRYTAPAEPRQSTTFQAPKPAEGPVFFKRGAHYYILGGTTCCACRGGSSIYVFMAPHPLGPWRYVRDIGRNLTQPFDPHSPYNYVTNAQASSVFELGDDQFVWLGNQWTTGAGTANSGLLYWTVLDFDPDDGTLNQVVWRPNATVVVSY